jgi:L-ascorbate metabolism protein UlaG (beta-lactamase superfamily)
MFRVLTTAIQSDTALIDRILSENNINRLKGIFVAHSHYDHSFDVAYITKKTGATLYGSPSTLNIARGGNVAVSQLTVYQPNQDLNIGEFTVRVIPSKHSPGNAQNDDGVSIDTVLKQPARYKSYTEGGSFDFLISHHGKKIYIKPSPNFIEGALDTTRADALFIGIGIVTKQPPEWQDAYYNQTVRKLKPSVIIPIHWDDFFYPASENLQMLPGFVSKGSEEFDFFINKTKADKIDFKILQGKKSILIK